MAQAALPLMAIGSIVQGVAGNAAAQTNAKIDRVNQQSALREGVAQDSMIRDNSRQAIGEQIAQQGASGFEVGTGSPQDALRQSGINAELDILNARRNAQMKAQGFQIDAELQKKAGTMSLINGVFGAAKAIGGARDYGSNGSMGSGGYSVGGY